MSSNNPEIKEKIKTGTRKELGEPPMYRVLLHNDNYTTMDFVVDVLVFVFRKTVEEATKIMLDIHRGGVGLCGVYTYGVAETKVDAVKRLAEENEFPLKCTMEKE